MVFYKVLNKKAVGFLLIFSFSVSIVFITSFGKNSTLRAIEGNEKKENFIKYAEFNVPFEALEKAMNIDIDSHEKEKKINWIDLLAFLAAKYGGEIKKQYKASDMDDLVKKIKEGENPNEKAHLCRPVPAHAGLHRDHQQARRRRRLPGQGVQHLCLERRVQGIL